VISVRFGRGCTQLASAGRDRTRTLCNRVDIELRTQLPTLPAAVEVRIDSGLRVIPEHGYGAAAMTRRSISFTLDAARPGLHASIIERSLRTTLFHECHHLVRGWVKHGGWRPRHFIEGVVAEGLACAFERTAADHALPWSDYPVNVGEWVDELLRLPASAPYASWMFRHPDGRRWIGYRAGTFIADRAIAVSGRSAAELAETGCAEILALAGITPPRAT
jgi:hypothetical protein